MILIKDILKYLDNEDITYTFEGEINESIEGFSSLHKYKEGTMTWIKNQDTLNIIDYFEEGVRLAIIQEGVIAKCRNKIITDRSKAAFFSTLERFFGEKPVNYSVGHGTYISPSVRLGKDVVIGHNCTIDGDIQIGDGTRIYNNVNIINRARIGKNCVIQSCVNIGHDGFAYTEDDEHNKTMVKHYGGTIVGDNVYIGGSTCIERGTIDDTVICDGAKIDVTCTIGHNSIIGTKSALVGGSVLLGSVKLEENSYIASALIRNQGVIGANAVVGMGSVVTKNVEEGTTVLGVPAKKIR